MKTDPRALARTSDPETSHEAARLLEGDKMALQALEFLAIHDRPEGWTAHEIMSAMGDALGMCAWHRLTDLRHAGLAQWLYDNDGHPVRRPGASSRTQRATVISVRGGQLYRLLTHHKRENHV